MRVKLITRVAAMLLACWCSQAPISAQTPDSLPSEVIREGYSRLAFREEFDQLDLSLDRKGRHRWFNGIWYKPAISPNSAFSVRNGKLTARAAPGYRGAQLTSYSSLSPYSTFFGYGYYEARMRWDVYPLGGATFWLVGEPAVRGTKAGHFERYCEFDIVEPFRGTSYHFAIHDFYMRKKSYETPGVQALSTVPIKSTEWHRFGMWWRPGRITLYRDGKVVSDLAEPKACANKRMFLIFGAQKRNDDGNQTTQFDWIRYYRR